MTLASRLAVALLAASAAAGCGGPMLYYRATAERPRLDYRGVLTWISFSPDGDRLLGLFSGQLAVWDPATGRLVRQVDSAAAVREALPALDGHEPTVLAVAPDGRSLATADEKAAVVWDYPSLRPRLWLPCGKKGSALRYSPDGAVLVLIDVPHFEGMRLTLARDFPPRYFRAADGRPIEGPRTPGYVCELIFTPDGRKLMIEFTRQAQSQEPGPGETEGFRVFDWTPEGKVVPRPTAFGSAKTTFAAGGRLLCSGTGVYDANTFRNVEGFRAPTGWGDYFGGAWAASPDGRWVATGASGPPRKYLFPFWKEYYTDSAILLWEADTKRLVEAHEGWSDPIAFSPDGKTFAVGVRGRLTLFDVAGTK
jgi:WD40 repeat protein